MKNISDFLINFGLCPNRVILKGLEQVAAGKPIEESGSSWVLVGREYQQSPYRYKYFPNALLVKPVSDLKTLLPNSFDKCGNVVGFPDSSLSGFFPDKDGDTNFQHFQLFNNFGLVGKKCE